MLKDAGPICLLQSISSVGTPIFATVLIPLQLSSKEKIIAHCLTPIIGYPKALAVSISLSIHLLYETYIPKSTITQLHFEILPLSSSCNSLLSFTSKGLLSGTK